MKKVLASGNTLEVTRSPFSLSHALFKAVIAELKKVRFEVGLKDGDRLSDLFKMDVSDDLLNSLKNAVFSILSSPEIEAILWQCYGRALWNNKKITPDLFDAEEDAQADYLEIAKEVMLENIGPFLRGLPSALRGLARGESGGTQK